jgi:hypothetical protein
MYRETRVNANVWRIWTTAAGFDRRLDVSRKQVAAFQAKRVVTRPYTRDALFQAISTGRPVVFSDLHVPVKNLSGSRLETLPALIVDGFARSAIARVQMGPSRKRSCLPVNEVIRKWERGRAILGVTDLHIRGTLLENELGLSALSDFNLMLGGSDAVAEQEMMTLVISTRGNVTDSHSDDPDGSNHCFVGSKLWLAWETFEGRSAGLEDNSRDDCVGDAAFDIETFLSLPSASWWTVSEGETLFLPGSLTHRVITLEHYLGVGSFFVALPSCVQTLIRWNTHGPLWSLGRSRHNGGLVDEIADTATQKVRELAAGPPSLAEHWGLRYFRRAAQQWLSAEEGSARNNLLRNRSFAELLNAALEGCSTSD